MITEPPIGEGRGRGEGKWQVLVAQGGRDRWERTLPVEDREGGDVEKWLSLLSIGLLQESTPELVAFLRLQEDQLAVECGESVVHHDVYPLAKVPETEVENASIPGEVGEGEWGPLHSLSCRFTSAILLQHMLLWASLFVIGCRSSEGGGGGLWEVHWLGVGIHRRLVHTGLVCMLD